MNWFAVVLKKLGMLPDVEVIVTPPARMPSEPVPQPEPVMDLAAIAAAVKNLKRNEYIILRGKCFNYVDARKLYHQNPEGNYVNAYVLSHMPDDFHRHLDYVPVPAGFVPLKLDDIETPGDWIEDIDECQRLTGRMEDLKDRINMVSKLIDPSEPMKFVKSGDSLYPCIKLFTDLGWIEGGWQGPAIIAGFQGDHRHPTATGIIPDEVKLYDTKDAIAGFEKFRAGPLQEMLTHHESVVYFNAAYRDLITCLDKNSTTYR